MSKENSELWSVLVGVLFFVIIFIVASRLSAVDVSYNDYCLEQHGEGWFFESNEYYGRFCAQVDNETFEILDREKMPSHKERREFCEVPSFFSFEKKEKCNAGELNLRKLKGGNK